jgi:hypothetical protein
LLLVGSIPNSTECLVDAADDSAGECCIDAAVVNSPSTDTVSVPGSCAELAASDIDVIHAMENCDPALVVALVTGMAKSGIRLSAELARSVMGWAESCHNLLVLLDDPVWDALDNDCAVYYCCWGTQSEAASARAGPEIGRAGGGSMEVSRAVNYDRIAANILHDGSLAEKTTDFLVAKMGQAADENWDLEQVEDFLWGSVSPCEYDPEAEALIEAWLKGATRP